MITFWKKVLRSFIYAGKGIVSATAERNMQVHLMALVILSFLLLLFPVTRTELFVLLIMSGLVLTAEMINTAVEELSNIVRDELKLSYIATQRARDVAAGAVLIQAIVAFMIGAIIFLPKIFVAWF